MPSSPMLPKPGGDEAAAAQWQAKCDAKHEELRRLARGPEGGVQTVSEQFVKAIIGLSQEAYHARTSGTKISPQAAEALAWQADLPASISDISAFLIAVAENSELPLIPHGLPEELTQILGALSKAIR